jgi:tetratricopeptide (TPR) repeat protein
MRYNTAAIRDLLDQALSDDELNTLVFDHFRPIYDRYFSASLTRQQKTQILIEQTTRRGETEQLLARVREINPAQMTPFAEQVLRQPPARSWTASRTRPVLVIGLIGLLALAGLGAVLLMRGPKPTPTFSYPQAATACRAEESPIRVGLRPLADCSPAAQAELTSAWTVAEATLTTLSAADPAPLRSWSQPEGYDLVISGRCTQPDEIELTAMLAAIRNPDDLYQPGQMQVIGPIAEAAEAGAALIAFQHGDYEDAAAKLVSAASQTGNRDLALLAASAVLFTQRYDEAIAALRELRLQHPDWSAVLNNLGVANFNRSLNGTYATAGEDTLDEAIELARQEKDRAVEFLALVNRANVHRHAGNNQKALADCQAAEQLDSASRSTRVCWLYYYFALIGEPEGESLPLEQRIEEELGVPQPSDPPRLQAMRGAWYELQRQPTEAAAAYERFLEQMQFHACLEQDRSYLDDLTESSPAAAR